jgi:hypothetical protein
VTETTNDASPEGDAPPDDRAARQVRDQRIEPNDGLAAVTLAFDLIDHGIPVVVCQPNPEWSPGAPCADVIPPKGWAVITAEESRPRLADYRPGVDTLAMVGGHGVDAVDCHRRPVGLLHFRPGRRPGAVSAVTVPVLGAVMR